MGKEKLGNISIYLIIIVPILFYIPQIFIKHIYLNTPSGNTILEDIYTRPGVAIPMLLGITLGIISFITGLISIIKNKNRNILVYISTILGGIITIYVLMEIISTIL